MLTRALIAWMSGVSRLFFFLNFSMKILRYSMSGFAVLVISETLSYVSAPVKYDSSILMMSVLVVDSFRLSGDEVFYCGHFLPVRYPEIFPERLRETLDGDVHFDEDVVYLEFLVIV